MKKHKTKNIVRLALLNIIFILLCLIGLIPILYALSIAFSKSGTMLSSKLCLLPTNPTLENFHQVLFEMQFPVWLKNSVILSLGTMIIAIGFSITSAYAFSRYRFKGRRAALQMLLLLNAFPQILSMFAIFRLFKIMHLLDQHFGLIIIYAGSMCIFSIWNLKSYFDTIPVEIEEASKIDGANDFKMLGKIILPLARPAIIVTAVMVLIFVWNEYLFSTTFLMNENSYSLAGGLYQLQTTDYNRNWPLFSAASLLVSVPVLIIFFCIQKYMVSGLTAGGVKG